MKTRAISGKTVSLSVLSQLLRYLESIGVNSEFGLDNFSDGRIPVEAYLSIEEKAAGMTGDPAFGFHVGQFYTTGSWSVLDYIIMNSRTLGEALSLSEKYGKIVSYVIKPAIKIRPGEIEIVLDVPAQYDEVSPHCYHTVQASMVQMIRKVTGKPISPLRVRCGNPEPTCAVRDEFSAFFNCPVVFGSAHYSIVLHPSIRHIALPQSDPTLLGYFQNLASDMMQSLEKKGSVTEAVISLMVIKLAEKDLTIRSIAREMGMSVRSLQLKLSDEQTVFSELLLQTRVKLANKYFAQNSTTEETAFFLGFSDTSSFCKAFKKWTGRTPGDYRRERNGSPLQ